MNLIKIMFIMSIFSLCWWRKNIIILLLSLEMMLSTLFVILSVNLFSSPSMSLLFMLTTMVSGSSLGLSLMIALCRFFKSSNSSPIWMLMFDKIYYSFNYNKFSII